MHRIRTIIVPLVAAAMGVAAADISSQARGSTRAARARQVAMYLGAVDLELGQDAIALVFERDRSTVSYAVQRVEDDRDDPAFDQLVHGLEVDLARRSACRRRRLAWLKAGRGDRRLSPKAYRSPAWTKSPPLPP
jgi:hypothetical protein